MQKKTSATLTSMETETFSVPDTLSKSSNWLKNLLGSLLTM